VGPHKRLEKSHEDQQLHVRIFVRIGRLADNLPPSIAPISNSICPPSPC
jgi:hypothetical protein